MIAPVRSTADVAAVADLFRAYAAGLSVDLAYQDFAGELAALPGRYAPPAGALLLTRGDDGMPHGCVALRRLDDAVCEMKRLYVVTAARGSGLGGALIAASIRAARARGYREMRLDTLPEMTAAQRMYRFAGFAPMPAYHANAAPGTIFLRLALSERSHARTAHA